MHPLNPLRPWPAPFFVLVLCLSQVGLAQTPAFPGALGFGRFATGGRGGAVYHVTNTNDSGAGSFRTGVTTANRTVVFDVSGVIRITSPVVVANNVTIAGQTAPGGGVTIYGHRLSYSSADNSITRFLRVRMGINGDGNDTITIASGHDMIFDHLSVSWGQDETFSISGSDPSNISIQSTMISQGLQTHSAGGLIQTVGGVSILRSFYIDNHTRNPKVKGVNEYVNNVVYNWESDAYIQGDSTSPSYANAINNYFINGPGSTASAFDRGNLNFHIYATNNWQDTNLNGVLDGAVIPQAAYGPVNWQTAPYNYPTTNALPPLTALKLAVSDVGASFTRDSVDERMLTELTSWGALGETIRTENDAPMSGPGVLQSGTAYADTDGDGLPDFWETALGTSISVANNNDPSPSGSGYTRLEDYLNWLAEPHGIALTNTTVIVELRQFTRGFVNSSPVYSIANITNGTATLLNGHLVRFVPNANFIGQAGFSWTVLDADGSTLTRPMNLFFTPAAQSFNPVWRGDDATNNWNTLADYNWFNGQSLLYPYHPGDSVTFDDSGSTNPAVNLIGSLQPAALTVDATKNFIFAGTGSLDGTMTLVKTGSGTLTLNTTNNFSGATTVSNGALIVNGALNQSAVTVRSGGTLGGGGSLALVPILNSGATLAPGGSGAGTLTISNSLTQSGGVINLFDLSNDPTGLMKTNDQVKVIGTFTASGKNIIRVNLPDGPLLNGIYTLFKCTSFIGSVTNFTLINANGVLTNPPGALAILVNNVRTPENLKWVGNGANNNWDSGATTNWLNGASPDVFYYFDSVLFDDTGSTNPAINLIGTNTPANVIFNATKNYTLAGNGRISGFGNFTKTNSGTLTILATNEFAGPLVIAGGAVSVASVANANVASPLGAGDNSPDNLVLSGGKLRFTGATASTDRGLTFNPVGGTIDVSSSATMLTIGGIVAGSGTLNKTGAGKLALNGVNTFSGGIVATEGTMLLGSDNAFGTGILTLDSTTNPVTLQFGVNGGHFYNVLNLVGTNNFISINSSSLINTLIGDGALNFTNGSTFSFEGDMTEFTGTVYCGGVANTRFYPPLGSANVNLGTGGPDITFDLGNTSALLNNRDGGTTIQLGALIGGPNTTLSGASSGNRLTTNVIGGKNLDTLFAGKITQVNTARANHIVKTGTGTLTLTAASTYDSSTTVNGGTLLVNNTTGSGTGVNLVTVNDGGTLGGNGFISGAVTINAGGALAPGSNNVGTLTLRSNLTLNAGAILNFEWVAGAQPNDRLAVTNNLILGGTLNISNVSGFAAANYLLMTYGGALSGVLPVIGSKPAGFSCTVNTNTAGQVRLIVQTQTPPMFGSIKLMGTNIQFSGSGGPTNVAFYVLSTTNLSTPLTNWTRLATNQFGATGNFNFTNNGMVNAPQSFYRIQLP